MISRTLTLLLTSIVTFAPVKCSRYKGLYYDKMNYTHAECIIHDDYVYLGTRSTDKDNNNCETWLTATEYHQELFRNYAQFYYPDEYLPHSHCRNIPLNLFERNPQFNNASAHSYVQTDGWTNGPWCYVKIKSNESKTLLWSGKFESEYRASPCFKKCDVKHLDLVITTTTAPELEKTFKRYNDKVFDQFVNHLFSEFDHGDKDYYEKRPSDDVLSPKFKKNREHFFFAAMPFLILSLAYIVGKHFWKKRKTKTGVPKGKQETDTKHASPIESTDLNKNLTTATESREQQNNVNTATTTVSREQTTVSPPNPGAVSLDAKNK